MVKKIGIFGGSFNPVHLGHIGLSINLMEAHSLDHVIFIPVGQNPFKQITDLVENTHRLHMLEIALSGMQKYSIIPYEMQRIGPSYTFETVLQLKKLPEFQEASLYLLLGEDSLSEFHLWKNVYELIKHTSVLVAKRNRILQDAPWQKDDRLRPSIMTGITETPIVDISSTMVRERLKKKLECRHLLDREVLEYIHKNNLYN